MGAPRRARSTLGEQLKQILCWTPLTDELPALFLISLPFCELSGTLSLCSCSPCSPSMVTVPLLLAMALGQFWPGWHTGDCAVPKTRVHTSPCPLPSKALSPNLRCSSLGSIFPEFSSCKNQVSGKKKPSSRPHCPHRALQVLGTCAGGCLAAVPWGHTQLLQHFCCTAKQFAGQAEPGG